MQLRLLDEATARSVLAGRRLADWSPGYPTDGDRDVARWLVQPRTPPPVDPLFRPYQVVVTANSTVVGGIGCHRPPDGNGSVEIGYGIAPEWRNQGLITEAVRILVDALAYGGVRTVVARTDRTNLSSQAVLRHVDFVLVRVDPDGLLRWERPVAAPPRPA